jgi:hypothetical protein
MTTKLTPAITGVLESAPEGDQLDALVDAIQLPQSECPCTTCVARSAKRAEYRNRPDVHAARKARQAAKRAAIKEAKEAAEREASVAAETQAAETAQAEVESTPSPKPKVKPNPNPAAKGRRTTPKQRATSKAATSA